LRRQKYAFLKAEGAMVVVVSGTLGDGVTTFGQSAGSRTDTEATTPPAIALAPDHYNRIVRLLAHQMPVELEVESKVRFLETPDSYNVIAEIPGTSKKEEVVMLGAHLDSWQGSTGATDNAAGSAVMIEAMRILRRLDVPMARTVRVALWGGEELGLLGSRAYVKDHFADPDSMVLKPGHAKLSAYFNVDYGAGRIRGIYLQGNDMLRPVFESWLKPFHDLDAKTLAPRQATGTDHLSFDAVGLPGFQFIQDSLEYGVTHHSNVDSPDHVQRADLMQAAAIVAAFVYQAATRPEMLPRKPLPRPKVLPDPYAGIPGVKLDIEYARPEGGAPLRLDAGIPQGAGPFPAVIFVHGGGFVGGARQPLFKPLYAPMTDAGIAWFTIDYRVAPAHRFPAAVDDVEAAVRFVRTHAAEYHVDPKRIALIGDSAGGHLVAYAGANTEPASRVSAVVSFYGPHDFTRNGSERMAQAARTFLGLTDDTSAEARKRLLEASPVSRVRRGMPPYLLIHGTADGVVPFAQSEELCARMRAAGASCELIPVSGGGHGLLTWEGNPEREAYKRKMFTWLRAVLVSGRGR
ncbi:MAG: M20/M25/M40 family metallo-hydrolase, partial [Acidobacteria bacterium]|nr:M20/M25/M40 family metallo-hydrolase [Acidobacteriota bacterium]